MSAKWVQEVVQKSNDEQRPATKSEPDNLKVTLLQCIRDAAYVVREAGIQFSNNEPQKLATTLFIQKSRNA